MFTGKMVTEAIPARVFALYKIVTSKKNISRLALQGLMEPKEIYEGTSYFSTILKTAIELKLVDVQDNYVTAIVPEEKLKKSPNRLNSKNRFPRRRNLRGFLYDWRRSKSDKLSRRHLYIERNLIE